MCTPGGDLGSLWVRTANGVISLIRARLSLAKIGRPNRFGLGKQLGIALRSRRKYRLAGGLLHGVCPPVVSLVEIVGSGSGSVKLIAITIGARLCRVRARPARGRT